MTTWLWKTQPIVGCYLPASAATGSSRVFDIASVAAAGVMITASWAVASLPDADEGARALNPAIPQPTDTQAANARELVVSTYVGAPHYHRSDVKLTRPDGTDLTLKALGWDGDALYFPIDGGVRTINWSGARGFMVDFLHNKAIARLGRGAHGRELTNGVIETVDAVGTLKGKPAPASIKLTDIFERLEFTHGHNVLLLTPVARLAGLTPRIRPYFGVGAGIAAPHVEVRFTGEDKASRTGEYQFAGPALQALAGLEFRTGRGSFYLEYKFTWASIAASLTGGESSKNQHLPSVLGVLEAPADLVRDVRHWWAGDVPKYGRLSTELTSHQLFIGAGYVWPRPR